MEKENVMFLIDYRAAHTRYSEAFTAFDEARAVFCSAKAKVAKVYSETTGDHVTEEDPRFDSIVCEMLEVAEAFDLHAATDVLIRYDYGDDKECKELAKKIRQRIRR